MKSRSIAKQMKIGGKSIHPDKSRGQNFLIDKNVLAKIVSAAELSKKDTVIEIGAGTGVLTIELAKRAGRVIAFEVDKKLIPILRENLSDFKNVEIVEGNVLETVGATHCGRPTHCGYPPHYKIVTNIPYNITSSVLEKFLSAENKPSLMVLLIQKEVADRICARPGEMSVLSVMVQYYGQPEIIARVPASAFWPRPKVESAVLKIAVGAHGRAPVPIDEKYFFQIVKAGFSRRRKMLKNNLVGANLPCRQAGGCSPLQIVKVLAKSGLSPTIRAEELSIRDWIKFVEIINVDRHFGRE